MSRDTHITTPGRSRFERSERLDTTSPSMAIRVDRVRCTGHGACAQVLPQAITLDEWGYPIVSNAPVDPAAAKEAVALCPALALYLQ